MSYTEVPIVLRWLLYWAGYSWEVTVHGGSLVFNVWFKDLNKSGDVQFNQKIAGKKNRKHFWNIFFLIFSENRFWYLMQIIFREK